MVNITFCNRAAIGSGTLRWVPTYLLRVCCLSFALLRFFYSSMGASTCGPTRRMSRRLRLHFNSLSPMSEAVDFSNQLGSRPMAHGRAMALVNLPGNSDRSAPAARSRCVPTPCAMPASRALRAP